MNYTRESNKEFAIKLMLMKLKEDISKIIAVNRGDLTNKEVQKIIKKLED
jgi:hypothetical protein